MPRNNKDFSEGQGREALEKNIQDMGLGASAVKDPFTGTTHVDLSDPGHKFWQPMFPDKKKDN